MTRYVYEAEDGSGDQVTLEAPAHYIEPAFLELSDRNASSGLDTMTFRDPQRME